VAGGLAVALDSGSEQKVKVHINTQRYR